MPTGTYTTIARIKYRISADGYDLRLDDTSTGTAADIVAQVIADASDEIEFYCLGGYSAAQLATSGWVLKIATDIAVWMLCWRRLNGCPEGAQVMADAAFERLEAIAAGKLKIPGLTPNRQSVPVLSNLRPRVRPFPRVVVTPNNSTGSPAGYVRHEDRLDLPDYTIAIMPFALGLLTLLSAVA